MMFKIKIIYKKYTDLLSYQHIGIAAIIIQWIFQYDFFQIPNHGLDNSWAIGINLALKEKLLFGSDFIFTYGPLGYLSTSLSIYASSFLVFIFTSFIMLKNKFKILFLKPFLF